MYIVRCAKLAILQKFVVKKVKFHVQNDVNIHVQMYTEG